MNLFTLYTQDRDAFIETIKTPLHKKDEMDLERMAIENNTTEIYDLIHTYGPEQQREFQFNCYFNSAALNKNYAYMQHMMQYASSEMIMSRFQHAFASLNENMYDFMLPYVCWSHPAQYSSCLDMAVSRRQQDFEKFSRMVQKFLSIPVNDTFKTKAFSHLACFDPTPTHDYVLHEMRGCFSLMSDEKKQQIMEHMIDRYDTLLLKLLPEDNNIELLKDFLKHNNILSSDKKQWWNAQAQKAAIERGIDSSAHCSRPRKM